MCTNLILERGREASIIGECRHVIIDEAQDLVNVRGDLVRALLEVCPGGFTVFADPAQSIYEHQAGEAGHGSADLLAWIRTHFASELKEHRLTKNFRARRDISRRVLQYGPRLQELQPDYAAVRRDLETFLLAAPWAGDLELLGAYLSARSGTVALLTRNNGEALLVSRKLDSQDVPHRLQPRAGDRVVHGWLAQVLMYWPTLRVGRQQMMRRLELLAERLPLSPEATWALCKQLSRTRSQDVDLMAVASRLQSGAVPQILTEPEPARTAVSTIHRAKGLEFDTVILTEPASLRDHDDLAEETRILYVALTRARDEVFVMPRAAGSPDRSAGGAEGFWNSKSQATISMLVIPRELTP
jgi:hypothetical protein